jgi:uncharacterized protein YraI
MFPKCSSSLLLFLMGCIPLILNACSQPAGQALPTIQEGAVATWAIETLEVHRTSLAQAAQETVIWLTRQAPPATPTITHTLPPSTPIGGELTLTPVPTFTPLLSTLIPTSNPAIIIALVDTNCRSGPDEKYTVMGIFYAGQESILLGRNEDSTWWYIEHPENPGESCWVWSGSTSTTWETASLPVIPTPTRVPLVDFELTYSNMHVCYKFDKYIIFRVENIGTETLYETTINFKDIKSGKMLYKEADNIWAPYMPNANSCPPGIFPLESGKRGFIAAKKTDVLHAGVRLRAYVRICTAAGKDKKCVEKDISFQF